MAALVALAGLVAGSGAAAASAATASSARAARHAAPVHVRGGETAILSAPGLAEALLGHAIVPLATSPGSQSLVSHHPVVERFAFPVVGGRVDLRTLRGAIVHAGGVLFLNLSNGKRVEVSSFIVDLGHRVLTGIVNGQPRSRIALFTLDISHVRLSVHRHVIVAAGIILRLTQAAAAGLNLKLGVNLFVPGLVFGTGSTALRI